MESQPNFEYLCRVCAANTKGRNSVAECVYILKTPSLKDKIEKYLYLSISENDPLPKVLCKTCFRQVEATASLSKIAKHTQKVFRDFMIFTKPGAVQADYNIGIEPNPHAANTTAPSTTANSNATSANSSCQGGEVLAAATIAADHTALSTAAAELSTETAEQLLHQQQQQHHQQQLHQQQLHQQQLHQQQLHQQQQQQQHHQQQQQHHQQQQKQHHHQHKHQHLQQKQQQQQQQLAEAVVLHKDEVVVNVSITDPLTRENSQKMINASQNRQNSLDSKFTPKSIAQRGFTSTPKIASSSASLKSLKSSTPGVLNFMGGQLHPQVTTFTSGGYVIGRMTTAAAITSSERPVESSHVLQQKRKNLKLALNNIRASALANSSGQVSLLKSSQKLSESNTTTNESKNTDAVAEKASTSAAAEKRSVAKLKSKSPQRSLSHQRVPEQQHSPPQPAETGELATAPPAQQATPPQSQQSTPPQSEQSTPPQQPTPSPPMQATTQAPPQIPAPTPHPSGIPDDIVLGRVIKDPDLLKLILKALKWPVTKQTLDMQMQRLRSSKFLEIMSDQNLLQDMDLTQILGPYLAPVLMAAQAIQQQQWAMASAAVVAKEAANAAKQTSPPPPQNQSQTKSTNADVQAMPYKLPAETSVQLINVNNNNSNGANELKETNKPPAENRQGRATKALPPRKMRKLGSQRGRDALIVISDEEENEVGAAATRRNSRRRLSKSTPEVSPKFNVDIDPSFLSQYGINSLGDETANDALMALLNRQRAALTRLQRGQRRRRNSNSNLPAEQTGAQEPPFNIEDIVLMEQRTPLIENEEPPTEKDSSTLTVTTSDTSLSTMRVPSFQLPAQVSMPLITRPIIKRRKTVIQASPARTSLNVQNNLSSVTGSTAASSNTMPSANTVTLTTAAPANSFLVSQNSSETSSLLTMESTATQVPSTVISIGTQVPSIEKRLVAGGCSETTFTPRISNYNSLATSKTSTASSTVKAKKLNPSKSALGQQLLEAVGLQKVHGQMSSSSNDNAGKTTASAVNKKQDSKQKPARKQEEPTVADADSTTKNVVKEVLVEAKQKNIANSVNFDVEEQIDKVALVVQSCGKQLSTTNKAEPTPQQEKEKKTAAQPARIADGRRRLTIAGTNRARKAVALLSDSKIDTELNTIEEVKEDSDTKTQEVNYSYDDDDDETDEADESEKLDISTSSTTTDQSVASSDSHLPMISPRKRARKRNEDNDPDFVEHRYKKNSDSVPTVRERGRGRAAALIAKQRVRDMENESKTKMDFEKPSTSSSSSLRPARISKTLSKYYKGPDKFTSRRGDSSGGRITRKRN